MPLLLQVLESLSGSLASLPRLVASTSDVVLLVWRSDSSFIRPGFSLSWSSTCVEGSFTAADGSCGACEAVPGMACGPASSTPAGNPCPAGRFGAGGSTACRDCTAPRGSACGVGSTAPLGSPCPPYFNSSGGTSACTQVPGCSGRVVLHGSGVVENPAGDSGLQQYTADEDCEWLLQADDGRVVALNVTDCDIVLSGDNLLAYDGNTSSAPVRWAVCVPRYGCIH
jgi:hypothetical protein